ncbi:hypothetical protein [Devosia lacusdianchii]|uniref:hypothetical protein n=1 Tax=Devosia lacusdianchii TaxID=2917991 RepID=UPI001F05FFFF|nr:hypothetical protein [Devosia sp. JXJ CY 41]
MARKVEGKTNAGGKLSRADMQPMLGTGTEAKGTITAEQLERHVEAAAADIAQAVADAKDHAMQPRSFGVATALHGLWIKDDGDTHFYTNIASYEQLAALIAGRSELKYRPIDLMGSGRLLEPWSVVFAPMRAGYYWQITSSEQEFIAKDTELFHAGFRVTSFNRRHGNFNATWTWTGDTGAQYSRWSMDWFGLLSWNRYYRDLGLRIVAIDRYGASGDSYAATWQPGDGEQIIEAPGGTNVYFGQPAKFLVHKYERQGLEVRAMGHNGHAVAAYRPKRGNYRQEWTYNTLAGFTIYNASCAQDGYRLSFLSHATWQTG